MISVPRHYIVIGRFEFDDNTAYECIATTTKGAINQFKRWLRKECDEKRKPIFIDFVLCSSTPIEIKVDDWGVRE